MEEGTSPSGGGEGLDSGTSARESSEDHGLCQVAVFDYVMSHEPSCKKERPISNVRFLFSFTGLWNLIACQCVVLTKVLYAQ